MEPCECPTAGAFGFGFSFARGFPSRSPAEGSGPAQLVDHGTTVPGRWRSRDTFVPRKSRALPKRAGHDGTQGLGRRIFRREPDARECKGGDKLVQLLPVRRVVNTIERLIDVPRRAHVRRDHRFFDHPVRRIALRQRHGGDATVLEGQSWLAAVEVERPPLRAARAQRRVHLEQRVKLIGSRCRFRVSQSGVRPNNRLIEFMGRYRSRLRYSHVADQCKASFARDQRADTVGKRLRQHRDDAVRQVDGISASPGFGVERGTGLYIMSDIGDRHYQSPAALTQPHPVYRIIEVARVRAIDGDQRQRCEIPATDRIARRHAPGRGDIEGIRPVDRHAETAKHGPSRPVGFVSCAQHGKDAAAVTPSVLPQ